MTTMEQATANLSAQSVNEALSCVMAELPNIGKGDQSPEGYAYRGIEQVTRHVQPLLAKYGVVIAPKATITDVRPSPAMKDGWTDVFMTVEWTITGPDGSTITAQTTGIGRDRADKGANKAQTQAFKYLLLHLLCIADGKDDADNHTYEHDRTEAPDIASAEQVTEVQSRLDALPPEGQDRFKAWLDKAGASLDSLPVTWLDHVDKALTVEEQKAAETPPQAPESDGNGPAAPLEPDDIHTAVLAQVAERDPDYVQGWCEEKGVDPNAEKWDADTQLAWFSEHLEEPY